MKKKVGKMKQGVFYFSSLNDALERCYMLRTKYPEGHVTHYDLGWAVQYYIGGPYYPELEQIGK